MIMNISAVSHNFTFNYSNVNSSNTSFSSSTTLPQDSIIIWAAITSLITFSGTVSGCFVIYIIWTSGSRGQKPSGSNLLIINVLFMHLFNCAINTPIIIYMVTLKNVYHQNPRDMCFIVHLLNFTVASALDWCNAGLSLHRIIALRFPTKYAAVTRRPVVWALIIFTWLAGLAVSIQYIVGNGGYYALISGGRCGVRIVDRKVTGILVAFSSYIPFGISAVFSVSLLGTVVWVKVKANQQVLPMGGHAPTSRAVKRRIRLAQTLLAAMLFEALCSKTWEVIGPVFPVVYVKFPLTSVWSRTCTAVTSLCVPTMICLMNNEYRASLKNLINPEHKRKATGRTATGARSRNQTGDGSMQPT